jgi:hypothetical protein
MRAVHVMFYEPDSTDHWINHVVQAISPPFSHCDLQFEDGTATSVYQGETVYLQKKNFSRSNYTRVSITLDEAEYARVLAFCLQAHKDAVRFDLMGMVCTVLPPSVFTGMRRPAARTFCSRYVLEALQCSLRPDFLTHNPHTTTPSTLYKIMGDTGKQFIHVSDTRMARMLLHNNNNAALPSSP